MRQQNYEYDHIETVDPTASVNGKRLYERWLNTTTGETFVCTDNTVDANLWFGNLGGAVSPLFVGDPYWDKVTILLNADNTVTENSANSFVTMTKGNSITRVANTRSPYADYCISANPGYFRPLRTAFDFEHQDFTIEMWMKTPSSQISNYSYFLSSGRWDDARGMWMTQRGAGTSWGGSSIMEFAGNTNVQFRHSIVSSIEFNDNTWRHVALSRNENVVRLFIDGVMDGKHTASGIAYYGHTPVTSYHPRICAAADNASYDWNGLLSDFCVTHGVGRYGSDDSFTPPISIIGNRRYIV